MTTTTAQLPHLRRDRDQEGQELHLCGWGKRGEWQVTERDGVPYSRTCDGCGKQQFWLIGPDGESGEWF